jgi:hypothetical protein
MWKTCDSYGNPGADINELQKIEQAKHENASASNIAIEILNSDLQAIGERLQEKKYPKKDPMQLKWTTLII